MIRKVISIGLTLAVIVGCSSIERAREAQANSELPPREELPALKGMNLPEIVTFALTNSPSVVKARTEVKDARLALKQIAADAPLVSTTPWNSLTASFSGNYSGSESGETFGEAIKIRKEGDPSLGISVDILVYDFGRNAAEAKAQAERVIAAEEALIDVGYDVFYKVAQANYGYLEKQALLDVAATNLTACAIRLEQVELQAEAGEAKPLDITRARLDLVEAEEKLVTASNDVVVARVELSTTVGVLDVEPGLGMLVSLPADGYHVLTNSPTYKAADARVRAASHTVDRAIADLYPSVSVTGSLSWSDPMWAFRWGIGAVQNLFSGFRKTTAVDRAVVALESACAARDDLVLSLAHDYELALVTRENAMKVLHTSEKALKTAEENLALVEEQLKIGEATRVDFSDAVSAVYKSRGSFYRAEADILKAEVALYALLGITPKWATPL